MKVPLLRSDFETKRFSALAKFVARHWPDAPLKLSAAQQTLARCLGYANLHDAQKSAVDTLPANVPSLAEALTSAASILIGQFGMDRATANAFVVRWPIFRLAFCKSTSSLSTSS